MIIVRRKLNSYTILKNIKKILDLITTDLFSIEQKTRAIKSRLELSPGAFENYFIRTIETELAGGWPDLQDKSGHKPDINLFSLNFSITCFFYFEIALYEWCIFFNLSILLFIRS